MICEMRANRVYSRTSVVGEGDCGDYDVARMEGNEALLVELRGREAEVEVEEGARSCQPGRARHS